MKMTMSGTSNKTWPNKGWSLYWKHSLKVLHTSVRIFQHTKSFIQYKICGLQSDEGSSSGLLGCDAM